MYGSSHSGLYLTLVSVICLGAANIIATLFYGLVLYILFEYPQKAIVNVTVMGKITHD